MRHTSLLHLYIRKVRPSYDSMLNRTRPHLGSCQALSHQPFLPRQFVNVLAHLYGMVAYGFGVIFRSSKPVSISTDEPASLAADFANLHEDRSDLIVRVMFDEWVVQERCWFVCAAVYEDHDSDQACGMYCVLVAGKEKTGVRRE